ncbi:MAG: VWA domain-containing protein [Bdellovibrionales bacterium]
MHDLLSSILPESFNFAQGAWLWGLAVLPVIWLLFALFYRGHGSTAQKLKDFADPHLIPHLLEDGESIDKKTGRPWKALALWSLLWILGVLALAGPRWDFTTVKAFAPSSQLVIVLDMSRSMDAADVKPSRLARARQEIEDILNAGAGTNIALIAFDAAPHMITPLSDDVSSIRRLLPSLTSEIVYSQGADLAAALDMAAGMLESASGTNKHVLVLSDGEFESSDAALYRATQRLSKAGARLHGFGFGSGEGAPIPDGKGGLVKDGSGRTVMTRLNEERFKRLVQDGGGLYRRASYLSDDTNALLSQVRTPGAAADKAQKTTMFWEERFYIFLLPALLLFLPFLRRGAAFPALVAFFVLQGAAPAHAFEWRDLFLNKEQQAARAVEEKQYDQAVQNFDDPYQKGVAQYRAGDYQGAAQSFSQSNTPEIREKARYNLGNAQLMGGQIEEAVKTYEALLKDNPDHEDAKYNLEIAKKLLEQQKQQQQNRNNQQNQDQDKQNQSGGSGQDDQDQDEKNQGEQQKQGENGQNQNEQNGENESASDQKGQDKEEGEKPDEQGREDKRKQEEQSGAQGDEDKRDQEQKDEDGQRKGQSAAQDEDGKKQDIDQQAGQESDRNSDEIPEQRKEQKQPPRPGEQENGQHTRPRTQKDVNADQWLERMESDPEQFLKNKFYIESQRAGATKGDDKW